MQPSPSPHEFGHRVTEAVRRSGVPVDGIDSILALEGGTSSLTWLISLHLESGSTRSTVAKVAPAGLEPVGNRDMVRQARIIQALAGAPGIAIPKILTVDAGMPPEVPPFFVMEFIEGDAWEPLQDPKPGGSPCPFVTERAFAAARMLARLHDVDPLTIDLADEQASDLEASVDKWARAFTTVDTAISTGFEECRDELIRRAPVPAPPRVLHGDWRLGNILCERNQINAVIDWEIWSLGDPRSDLAWFRLAADPSHPRARKSANHMPTPDQLSEEYVRAGGSVSSQWWFDAFVRFKQSAIAALNGKRHVVHGIRCNPYADISRHLLSSSRDILALTPPD
jgi:aminoglycoside phosphotransferase (APT) family kinase protein